jgi:hypothetical protein
MYDGDICRDDERYGGFGAAVANSLAAYSAAPARVVAAVTAAHAPLPVDFDPLLTLLKDIAQQAILDRLQLDGRSSMSRPFLRPIP